MVTLSLTYLIVSSGLRLGFIANCCLQIQKIYKNVNVFVTKFSDQRKMVSLTLLFRPQVVRYAATDTIAGETIGGATGATVGIATTLATGAADVATA